MILGKARSTQIKVLLNLHKIRQKKVAELIAREKASEIITIQQKTPRDLYHYIWKNNKAHLINFRLMVANFKKEMDHP